MNNTGDVSDLLKVPAASTSQRIVPEGDRYRWEQQWMRDNRNASGVISNGGYESSGAPVVASDVSPQVSVQHLFVQEFYNDATNPNEKGTVATQKVTVDSFNLAPIGTTVLAGTVMYPVTFAQTTDPVGLIRDAAPASAAAVIARYKSNPKQFALWRDDDEVKISMRLAQSETQSPAAIGALRQWLKDLHLKLTTLTVNGSVRWQAKSRNTDGY